MVQYLFEILESKFLSDNNSIVGSLNGLMKEKEHLESPWDHVLEGFKWNLIIFQVQHQYLV